MRKNTNQTPVSPKLPSDIDGVKIKSEIVTQDPPALNGLPSTEEKSGMVRGTGTVSQDLSADPRFEFVSGGGYAWLANYIRSLPFYIDDLSRDFGDDIYERIMIDPQASSAIATLKESVLELGVTLHPVKDQETTRPNLGLTAGMQALKEPSALSREITDFCQRAINGLQRDFIDTLYEMLDALAYGNRIAEQVYKKGDTNADANRLTLKALKVKPRTSYAFVVDVYMNVLGIIGLIPGQGAPIIVQSIIGEPGQIPNLLPRAKFAVLTNRSPVGDPRGQSDLRPAYDPWWEKQQIKAERLKYLTQFGSPTVYAITPQNAQKYYDPQTSTYISPEQAAVTAIQEMRNGSAAGFPYGTTVGLLEVHGDGEAFERAFDDFNREITKAILYQTLATEEGKHQTRAASQTHEGILQLKILRIRKQVASFIRNDILKPLLQLNVSEFGENAVESLLPIVALGPVGSDADFSETATGVSSLVTSGFVHSSQYPGLDEMLGLPERDIQAQNAEIAANAEAAKEASGAQQQANISADNNLEAKKQVGKISGG